MQPSGAECAFHPIYDARALAQQVFPARGWGAFRAQKTHKRVKDKAAHACHALCRARVADGLRRAGERRCGEHLKMVLSIIDRQER